MESEQTEVGIITRKARVHLGEPDSTRVRLEEAEEEEEEEEGGGLEGLA